MAMNGIVSKVSKGPCGYSCNVIKCMKWNINESFESQRNKFAIVVLNRIITQNKEIIKRFWNNASLRITVDGGTVHWDNFVNNLPENEQMIMKMPDLVTGDFDSITIDVMEKYKQMGCKIIHTPNQDHTDFTKALIELNNYCQENKTEINNVIVLAQSSGRIDHILGNIQTLHLVKENYLLHPKTRVYIMSDDSLSWLLDPGDHIIDIPEESRIHDRSWCSLIPIGGVCANVTTAGLKWNLDNQELRFGKLVSTSNTFDGFEQVKIKCSHKLLWSMKVPSLSSN